MKQFIWSGGNPDREAFTTIDDAIQLSQELLVRLSKIREYKYPLAVRKGVKIMEDKNESKTVRAGAITYFFDIKQTKDKKPFMVITESRFKGEDEGHERKSIVVFQDNIQEFSKAVSEIAANLE
ncbi:MAG: DUF3276 family protein [Chloroflexi bacterium]|nr:DUF3276 family protein [Chloroflexota bacterium]